MTVARVPQAYDELLRAFGAGHVMGADGGSVVAVIRSITEQSTNYFKSVLPLPVLRERAGVRAFLIRCSMFSGR